MGLGSAAGQCKVAVTASREAVTAIRLL